MDEARSTRESEKSILDDLKWLNLIWDEGPEVDGPYGPYRQSERKHIYKAVADQLIKEGKAYRCFCSEEELEQKKLAAEAKGEDPKYDGTWRDAPQDKVDEMLTSGAPYTVRFKVPPGKVVSIEDMVRGRVTWDAGASLGDFIIMRSNGMPVYNFCVSVDDASMKITHVIRAEEHLTNTLRQMLIMEAMNYRPPAYAHCSLILGQDRSKLSKRHGATSVKQFSLQGFLPNAMVNYLANLGWNDGTPKEIYSPEELIKAFDLARIIPSSAVFDMAKLTWINSQHARSMPFDKIKPIVLTEMQRGSDAWLDPEIYGNSSKAKPAQFDDFLDLATKLAQRDMDLTTDTNRLVGNCFKYHVDDSLVNDPHAKEVLTPELQKFIDLFINDFDKGVMPKGSESNFADLWKAYMKSVGDVLGLKGKALFHPIRFLLTGRMSGPDVGDQLRLLSLSKGIINQREEVIDLSTRINRLRTFSVSDSLNIAEEVKGKVAAVAAETPAVDVTGDNTTVVS